MVHEQLFTAYVITRVARLILLLTQLTILVKFTSHRWYQLFEEALFKDPYK